MKNSQKDPHKNMDLSLFLENQKVGQQSLILPSLTPIPVYLGTALPRWQQIMQTTLSHSPGTLPARSLLSPCCEGLEQPREATGIHIAFG